MPTSFQLVRLAEILRQEIPLSASMEIELLAEGEGFVVEAPLNPNRNLQGTMFGGSLSAIALLAGWSWLRLALRDVQLEPDIVIQRAALDFQVPARGRVRARPLVPEEETWERFLRTLRRRSIARIAIEILIESPVEEDDGIESIGPEGPPPENAVQAVGWFVASTR